jgi:plastocyanin
MSKSLNLHRNGGKLGARLALAAAVLAALTLVACSPSSEAKGNVSEGKASDASVEITIEHGSFDPDTVDLPAGEEVTIQLTNDDGHAHDFAIEALDINTGTIESGKSAYATFVMPDEPVDFVCTFHSGMEGRIEPQ